MAVSQSVSTSSPVDADQGPGQPIGAADALPRSEEPFGAEPSVVDAVAGAPAHPDHATVLDGDVARAAVAAQRARGLHPPVDVRVREALRELLIHPDGPLLPRPKGVRAPQISAILSTMRFPAFVLRPALRRSSS